MYVAVKGGELPAISVSPCMHAPSDTLTCTTLSLSANNGDRGGESAGSSLRAAAWSRPRRAQRQSG